MIACILEKLSLVPAFCILYFQGRFPQLWLPLLGIDFVFAALFYLAYRKTGSLAANL